MKFSICLSTGFEGVMYPIPFAAPADFVAQAQLCERLGYDSVWGNDHITTENYVAERHGDTAPNFYEPLITLAMCAQATERIRLGTALLVMPMREPVFLAKQVATLDRLSGGRFILGVGLGAVLVLVFALLSDFAQCLLLNLADRFDARSYEDVMEIAFGTAGRKAVSGALAVSCFTANAAHMKFISVLSHDMFDWLCSAGHHYGTETYAWQKLIIIPICCFCCSGLLLLLAFAGPAV